MSEQELLFCENYERKTKELQLLELLKVQLTPKGENIYNSIRDYLLVNLDLYMSLTNK